MDIILEQNLAAVARYIQDNTEDGTVLYFDEIPEDFFVPSVYFQAPYTSGRKQTLRSYSTTITMNCWFMDLKDWDAYGKASDMRDNIMLDDCKIPIFDRSGKDTGRTLRVKEPETRKIDEGIVQLTITFDSYFHAEKSKATGVDKVQKFYIAWNKEKQDIEENKE
jgi:hypothetical protein